MAELIIKENFENAEWVIGDGTTDHSRLNLPIPHHFVFQGVGGARAWIETDFAHSGSKCIGMHLYDVSKSRRNAFAILDAQDVVGDEYTMRVWHRLNPDFRLGSPTNTWYVTLGIMTDYPTPESSGGYYPNYVIMLNQGSADHLFDVLLFNRKLDNSISVPAVIYDYPLPRGRFFQWEAYLLRHPTDGKIKVKLNGETLFDLEGIPTKFYSQSYFIQPAKIYHSTDDPLEHYTWIGDLELWSGMAPPLPTPISPGEGIPVVIPIAVGAATYALSGNPLLASVSALGGALLSMIRRARPGEEAFDFLPD